MWINLAADGGAEGAASNRDYLASQMTPQQISDAQQLAKKCRASNFKDCD
jgi:hypothetical protein